jgi:periplasmic copper chaperone A
MMRSIVGVLAMLAFCSVAWAGDIVVSRAVVVAQLTGISTTTASSAMLHENVDDNGVMKMLMLEKLDIPEGGKVVMGPAKLHVMLMGPKAVYKIGTEVPFEMVFAGAGQLQVMAKVVSLSEALSP